MNTSVLYESNAYLTFTQSDWVIPLVRLDRPIFRFLTNRSAYLSSTNYHQEKRIKCFPMNGGSWYHVIMVTHPPTNLGKRSLTWLVDLCDCYYLDTKPFIEQSIHTRKQNKGTLILSTSDYSNHKKMHWNCNNSIKPLVSEVHRPWKHIQPFPPQHQLTVICNNACQTRT